MADTVPQPGPAATVCQAIVLPRGGSWSAGANSQLWTGWVEASGVVQLTTAAPGRTLTVRPVGVPGPSPLAHGEPVEVGDDDAGARSGIGERVAEATAPSGAWLGTDVGLACGGGVPRRAAGPRSTELLINGDDAAAGVTESSATVPAPPQAVSAATSSTASPSPTPPRPGRRHSGSVDRMPFGSVSEAGT